jgi:hypothetical protein
MRVIACVSFVVATVGAFSVPTSQKNTVSKSPIFETLKFDGAPTFDVLAKTKQHVEMQISTGGKVPEDTCFCQRLCVERSRGWTTDAQGFGRTQVGLDILTAFRKSVQVLLLSEMEVRTQWATADGGREDH